MRVSIRLAAVAVSMVIVLGGCTLLDRSDEPAAQENTARSLSAVLNARGQALREGKVARFLGTVNRGDAKFVQNQRRLFANLQQLPFIGLRYQLDETTLSRIEGTGQETYQAVVLMTMQLTGYDATPVATPYLFRFTRTPEGWVVASDRDAMWATQHSVPVAPWDVARIQVATQGGVLGIFDNDSIEAAPEILDAVESGVGEVADQVPYRWSGNVVVYALSQLKVLSGLPNLPGGDASRLDGVAFPVMQGPRSSKLAAMRFMLNPRMLDADAQERSRLIRHELTHVAIGERDDRAPKWLSEGLAEYVSVQPLPEADRVIARQALDVARAGLSRLPRDAGFNGDRSAANYGISWWACEVIADAGGEAQLWALLDAYGRPNARRNAVLQRVTGLTEATLAHQTSHRIVATFG